nr:membrane protein insertion efficiency factor YidD [uncultured Draconibacterium sp.]
MQNQSHKVNRTFFLLLFLLLVSLGAYSQQIDLKSDLLLIDSVVKQQMPVTGHRPYIYKNQPKTFRNTNPVSLIYGGSLYVYQNLFSQHLSASCLYNPSCSDFSKQAVKDYGLIKGTLLSFDRLSRCNRIAATDLDPSTIDSHVHRFHDSIKKYK